MKSRCCNQINVLHFYIISPDDLVCDSKPPHGAKCSYKWSLEEVGSRARSERVSKFYGRFAEEAERLGISHACFASYLGYRYVTFRPGNEQLFISITHYVEGFSSIFIQCYIFYEKIDVARKLGCQ